MVEWKTAEETLTEQLMLLHERSKSCETVEDLAKLTKAMALIVQALNDGATNFIV